MNNNSWFKKENPFQTVIGFGGGATGFGAYSSSASKIYVDDVFSTYLYTGNGSSLSVANGIDNSDKGGMVWTKSRSSGSHIVTDTVRGAGKGIVPNASDASSNNLLELSSFNSDGFSLGSNYLINDSGTNYASWNWAINEGFFDVVQYTGNGSAGHQVAHSLGCEVGFMMVKRLENSANWSCYHRDAQTSGAYVFVLNSNGVAGQVTDIFNDTAPTSTHFTLGTSANTNGSGETYVCYLFAGGESTAATATSCNFLGTSATGNYDNNKINVGTTSGTKTADLVYGTGDFTMEAWVKCESSSNSYRRVFNHGQEWGNGTHVSLSWDSQGGSSYQNKFSFWSYNLNNSEPLVASETHTFDDDGQWHHVAVSRQSGTVRIFVDGILEGTTSAYSGSTESVSTNYLTIGATHNANVQECFKGNISNVRIVKGTALYTSSFRPPYEPLTNVTNTVLLCCNGSSVTSATVTPITLTVGDSSVTASTNSPFDDPNGFKFGEEGDENIIKCGSYVGNSTANNEIYVGWEPQWWLVKNITDSSSNWQLLDSMRGWVSDGNDEYLVPNNTSSEGTFNFGNPTPTGFNLSNASSNWQNESGSTYVYIAIRRPDGYVGKPVEAGTEVFAMDTGAGSSTIPNFDSGFPVDLSLIRNPTGSASWWAGTRLTAGTEIKVNGTDVPSSWQYSVYDSNVGWQNYSGHGSSEMSWMWKRHAGFDVMTYLGDGASSRTFAHSLGRTPEMMWVRGRGPNIANWYVYHKDLDNANRRNLKLENIDGQSSESTGNWNDTFPTATHFTVGVNANNNGDKFVTMLFSSVENICKVGSYIGNASASGPTINLGFAPRFILIKCKTASTNWFVYDTLRGLTSGNDQRLILNSTGNQTSADDIDPTATGFQVVSTWDQLNDNNTTYTYYAHA